MATTTTKPKIASRSDVKAEAKKMADEYLSCRDVGHTWRQFRVVRVRGGYNRDLFCPTCKTNRHEFISRTGERLSSGYTYPKGYQLKGLGRVIGEGRNIIRLESVVRTMDKAIQVSGEDSLAGAYAEGEPVVTPVPEVQVRLYDQTEENA